MTREELIQWGYQIIEETDDDRQEELMELFDRNVPHPEGSSLFFYPENYNARTMDISSYDPAVEEVVDKCLAYQPVINGWLIVFHHFRRRNSTDEVAWYD